MTKQTVLITGATGFLGRTLAVSCLKKGYKVIGTGYSESGIKNFERTIGNDIPIYAIDISKGYTSLKNIIKKHEVQYIVHAAALKHVGICEANPTRAIGVNVIGSRNVVNAAIECNVKNVIGVSTDKSIKPLCVYGMTKKLMEEILLEHNFGVFQGVNFLFSTESVLDIWDKLRLKNEPILVNMHAERYFVSIDDVSNKIIASIDEKKRFTVNECYRVSISNLQKAFSKYHQYWNVDEYTPLDIEKIEEDLPLTEIHISTPSIDLITTLLDKHYKEYQ